MREDSYFFGMRGLGGYGCIPQDGGQFLLYSINGDNDLKRCFAEEDFHEIIDFNDLPNSLFACNVHQSVFEDEDSKGHDPLLLARICVCYEFWGWSSVHQMSQEHPELLNCSSSVYEKVL